MRRIWVWIALSLLVGFGFCESDAAEPTRNPSDYFVEQWMIGTVGGLLTGPVMEHLTLSIYCGPEEENPTPEKAICQGLGTLFFRTVFYVVGIPIGVSAGVILDGWVHGLNGSISATVIMSIFGSTSWMLWALVLNLGADYIGQQPQFESLKPWVDPFKTLVTIFWPTVMTSLMATLTYESSATAKPASSAENRPQLGWTVSVLHFRF